MTEVSFSNSSQIQPEAELDFNRLVELEQNLEIFKKKSWGHQIPIIFLEKLTDYLIIDEPNNRIIVFVHGLSQDIKHFNISRQIVSSWLYGNTRSNQSDVPTVKNSRPLIELFFNGSKNDIIEFRAFQNFTGGAAPSLDWQVLHYPIQFGPHELKEYVDRFIDENEELQKYEKWIAYGIVSSTYHLRSNKIKVIEIITQYFAKEDFDISKPFWTKDTERNYAPIVLFNAKKSYRGGSFTAMVGISFGFDNGVSSFRIAVGATFDGGQSINLNQQSISKHPSCHKFDADLTWVHHTTDGSLENKLERFFQSDFNLIFNSLDDVVNHSKNIRFQNNVVSERRLLSTHWKEYKEYEHDLLSSHHKYIEKYGLASYSHFLSWLDLSENFADNKLLRAKTKFISSQILLRI